MTIQQELYLRRMWITTLEPTIRASSPEARSFIYDQIRKNKAIIKELEGLAHV